MSGGARTAPGLATALPGARAADCGAASRARVTAVTDLATGSGTAPGETLLAPAEPEELLLQLGRRGAEEARQPLLRLLQEAGDPDTAARVAEVLVKGYGDDTGLQAFQGDLATLDAVPSAVPGASTISSPRRSGAGSSSWRGSVTPSSGR